MCLPKCHEVLTKRLSRRDVLRAGASIAMVSAAGCVSAKPAPSAEQSAKAESKSTSFSRAVDLTYTLTPEFPTFDGKKWLKMKRMTGLKKDGYNTYNVSYFEHIGTHIDAPIHFSDGGLSVDQIPASKLVLPLAVIDIREKADKNADATLTPDDIRAWESKHGPLPDGGAVAMFSGWDKHVQTAKFRNVDRSKVMHFPGFHTETAEFLLSERKIEGIAVDTLSLDHGASKDFGVHYKWLPAGRWGLESVANLGSLPPRGATLVVGAPTFAHGTGGPTRVFALVS